MALQIEDLGKQDQDEIKRILSLGELVAKDEEVIHLHARRDYISKSLLKPFVSRFQELDLADYPKPVSTKEIAEEVKAEKESK
jgi:hypothetical protein